MKERDPSWVCCTVLAFNVEVGTLNVEDRLDSFIRIFDLHAMQNFIQGFEQGLDGSDYFNELSSIVELKSNILDLNGNLWKSLLSVTAFAQNTIPVIKDTASRLV